MKGTNGYITDTGCGCCSGSTNVKIIDRFIMPHDGAEVWLIETEPAYPGESWFTPERFWIDPRLNDAVHA